ncbi:3-methyl-2-oxobutanoate hydroxymethyltransferase [Glycocaulis abyssi]|uniref:3-methyl-2-oxobutanoate hydroxymethyltransferase n=1 Tax=Glycocaulis abyssi TaxID=1433403 RepID=A0ABV9N8F6_9PROT
MSAQSPAPAKRIGVPDIRARKGGEPLVCLTAYDAPTARLLDPHCDLLLVGDSVGMVVHGLPNTIPVTLEMMILHGQAVMRGASRSMVVVDMPFGSYEASPEQAFSNAARILRETGAQAVKLESGVYIADTIRYLAERGVPVMAHVGLRPQAALAEGGFKAKGRNDDERARVISEAQAADAAGAFAIVIEGVAEDLAAEITGAVAAPTIGIGASASCDGQILVTPDMLGLFDWTPRFVKRYADLKALTEGAVRAYADDVRARRFPGPDQVYRITRA